MESRGIDDTMIPIILSLVFGVIFIVRELTQMLVFRGKFWSYVLDPWNIIDILSATGVITTMIWLILVGVGDWYKNIASITAILMWLKMLGVIKALHQKV